MWFCKVSQDFANAVSQGFSVTVSHCLAIRSLAKFRKGSQSFKFKFAFTSFSLCELETSFFSWEIPEFNLSWDILGWENLVLGQ